MGANKTQRPADVLNNLRNAELRLTPVHHHENCLPAREKLLRPWLAHVRPGSPSAAGQRDDADAGWLLRFYYVEHQGHAELAAVDHVGNRVAIHLHAMD